MYFDIPLILLPWYIWYIRARITIISYTIFIMSNYAALCCPYVVWKWVVIQTFWFNTITKYHTLSFCKDHYHFTLSSTSTSCYQYELLSACYDTSAVKKIWLTLYLTARLVEWIYNMQHKTDFKETDNKKKKFSEYWYCKVTLSDENQSASTKTLSETEDYWLLYR